MPLNRMSQRLGGCVAITSLILGSVGIATAFVSLDATASAAAPASPTIYIANSGSSTVTAYPLPSTGGVAPTSTLSASALSGPFGEVFDASGNLWVTNSDTIVEFTPSQLAAGGSSPVAVTISSSALADSNGMAFDRAGDLWVSNSGNNTLVMFTPTQLAASGAPVPAVTISATGGSLDIPEQIAFDGSGDLWVTSWDNSEIQEYTPSQLASGGALTPAVTISSAGLSGPQGIAFDAAGDAWVGNWDSPTVVEFTPSDLAVSGAPPPAVTIHDDGSNSSIDQVNQMQFDSTGDLWFANFGSSSVSGFSPSQLASSGSPSPTYKLLGGSSDLNGPGGLALATPPEAPTGVTASLSGTNATVTWNALSGPVWATDYQVTPIVNGVAQPTIDTGSSATTFSYGLHGVGSLSFSVTASNVFGTGPASAASNALNMAPGYWLVASDGGIFALGSSGFHGSLGSIVLNKPIVGMAATPTGQGYWLVASDGGVFAEGDAQFYGSMGGKPLNKPIVGVASTPDGKGYWLVASDGGIFNFGDAGFYGSLGSLVLNKPIVGMASTPDGGGYWLVASDGGVFTKGDAQFYGSLGSLVLNKPIVGMAPTPDGAGYWLVASDGGVFTKGDAQFYGSLGSIVLNEPIVGIAATPDGRGYWLVASDGGVFSKGDAVFGGSEGGTVLNKPIVGMAG
jgi:sugar lactone lactonase YvrE